MSSMQVPAPMIDTVLAALLWAQRACVLALVWASMGLCLGKPGRDAPYCPPLTWHLMVAPHFKQQASRSATQEGRSGAAIAAKRTDDCCACSPLRLFHRSDSTRPRVCSQGRPSGANAACKWRLSVAPAKRDRNAGSAGAACKRRRMEGPGTSCEAVAASHMATHADKHPEFLGPTPYK